MAISAFTLEYLTSLSDPIAPSVVLFAIISSTQIETRISRNAAERNVA